MNVEALNGDKAVLFDVKMLAAYAYEPKVLKSEINNRRFSALVYVLKGEYRYLFGEKEIILKKDDLIYLPPYGVDYSYEILSEKTRTMQVDFEIHLPDQSQVALSSEPQKVQGDTGRIKPYMESLVKLSGSDTPSAALEKKAKMILALSALLREEEAKAFSKEQKKIAPAVEWLSQNFREPFSAEHLADLCDLSQSQFRRLFKTVVGKTPMEYRNELRITAAERMLLGGHLNVSEVAFATGFEDIYAFSHAFKKAKGISPSRYRGDE